MERDQPSKIALIIPMKNELQIAHKLINQLELHFKHSILDFVLLIDDHSTDGMYAFLKEKSDHFDWLRVVRNEYVESGYGSAVSFGIDFVHDLKITWTIIADSDLTNPLEEIEKLAIACLSKSDSDTLCLVKGNRYWGSSTHMTGVPTGRKTLSIVANIVSRFLSFNVHPDPTNGFRAIRISRYPRFEQKPGFESIIQELYEIKRANLDVGIFNTTLSYDQDIRGQSSFKFEMSLLYSYIDWLYKIGKLRVLRKSRS